MLNQKLSAKEAMELMEELNRYQWGAFTSRTGIRSTQSVFTMTV